MKNMHFLVVGCGSIGQRHIKNLRHLGYKVSGCEVDRSRAARVKKSHQIEVFGSLSEALKGKYDGAFVCAPTSLHMPVSIEIAKKGINLFIEKPISNGLGRIDELSSIVDRKKLVVLVGCNTRFFPGFKLAKRLIDENRIGKVLSAKAECGFYLPYWHPYEDYRKGYSANKRLGGGVIFDDIHEIDSLLWVLGDVKRVFCLAETVSGLDIDTEDVAEITLKFKSGAIGQIHLDYLQQTYRRYYEFIGERGVIVWDYIKQTVELYTEKTNQRRVYQESINTNREIMFVDEVKHFINCVKGREESVNNIPFARKVLEVALACHRSARKGAAVSL